MSRSCSTERAKATGRSHMRTGFQSGCKTLPKFNLPGHCGGSQVRRPFQVGYHLRRALQRTSLKASCDARGRLVLWISSLPCLGELCRALICAVDFFRIVIQAELRAVQASQSQLEWHSKPNDQTLPKREFPTIKGPNIDPEVLGLLLRTRTPTERSPNLWKQLAGGFLALTCPMAWRPWPAW